MAYYVILNFEDASAAPATGLVTGSTKSGDWKTLGAGAAAEGTAMVYQRRATRDSKLFDKKKVVYYPCQELIERDASGTLGRDDVALIREDCRKAKTIAFVIHGQPSDTDQGFSTTGGALCRWSDLARLAMLLLPNGSDTYRIALIMCYGARSSGAMLNHDGALPEGELKSSFAYKFFRSLCRARNIRLSAWTGAVSNDANMMHTVEQEGEVMLAIEKQSITHSRGLNKATMDQEKQELVSSGAVTNDAFGDMLQKFANQPNLAPVGPVETFAKNYVIYSPYAFLYARNKHSDKAMGNTSKYGKFVYSYAGGNAKIEARYATDNHGPNHVLFEGPLY